LNLADLPEKIGDLYKTKVCKRSGKGEKPGMPRKNYVIISEACISDLKIDAGTSVSVTFKMISSGHKVGPFNSEVKNMKIKRGSGKLKDSGILTVEVPQWSCGDMEGCSKIYARFIKLMDILSWFEKDDARSLFGITDEKTASGDEDLYDTEPVTDLTPVAASGDKAAVPAADCSVEDRGRRIEADGDAENITAEDLRESADAGGPLDVGRVLGYITRNPHRTRRMIAKETGMDINAVGKAILSLKKENKIIDSPFSRSYNECYIVAGWTE
jgi:hypothetical protein